MSNQHYSSKFTFLLMILSIAICATTLITAYNGAYINTISILGVIWCMDGILFGYRYLSDDLNNKVTESKEYIFVSILHIIFAVSHLYLIVIPKI